MELRKEIARLWENYETKSDLPDMVQQRKYAFFENRLQKDILILGLNPLFETESRSIPKKYKVNDFFQFVLPESICYGSYFESVKQSLKDFENTIDLTNETAYTDLFYYRTTSQKKYLKIFNSSETGQFFLENQLKITQKLIEEVIKPKVIIVTRLEVLSYMTKSESGITMDYHLEHENNTLSGFKVYEIKNNSESSNLTGTRVIYSPDVFTQSETFLKAQEILNELYKANKVQKIQTKKNYLEVDYNLFFNYPSLYETSMVMVPQLRAIDEQVVLNLKICKTRSLKETAKMICEHLFNENVLNEKEIIKLSSIEYCMKKFDMEGALLEKRSKKQRTESEPYFVFNEAITSQKEKETKEKLERWYIRKMYRHFKSVNK